MPKISDILGGLKSAEMNECATLIQVSNVMRCSVAEVREKFAINGAGMIYTRGLIMSDTPKHRAKLTEMYGEIIVLFEDGTVYCRTKAQTGQINRHQKIIKRKRERDLIKREIEQRRKERNTLRIFKDAQTHPSAKKQGRANSHSDIGQYQHHRPTRFDDVVPRYKNVFATINIPGLYE